MIVAYSIPFTTSPAVIRLSGARCLGPHTVGIDWNSYAPDVEDWGPVVIPPDSFLALGDRDASYDSRYCAGLGSGGSVSRGGSL